MRLLLAAALALVVSPGTAWACYARTDVSTDALVRQSDLVVRARATGYEATSGPARLGEPGTVIQFAVLEVLRGGKDAPLGLRIPGTLSERDDFNDRPAPYSMVRPGGRDGSCFARTYRNGGEFLLFLKKGQDGAYTPYWAALAPVNEQLRSAHDPWIEAVRDIVARVPRIAARLE